MTFSWGSLPIFKPDKIKRKPAKKGTFYIPIGSAVILLEIQTLKAQTVKGSRA